MSNRTNTFDAIYSARKRNLFNQTLQGNKLNFFSSTEIILARSTGLDSVLAPKGTGITVAEEDPVLTQWITFDAVTKYIQSGPMASDGAGNFFIGGVYTTGPQGRIVKVNSSGNELAVYNPPAGSVTDYAGGGWPWGLAYYGGFLYAADMEKQFIYKFNLNVTPPTWTIVCGTSGTSGDLTGNGVTRALLNGPMTLLISPNGNSLYICQANNHKISRFITPTGILNDLTGSSPPGYLDGIASVAKFDNPTGMFFDNSGNIIVLDTGNNRIRKINVSTLITTTVAGTGVASSVDGPVATATFDSPFTGCCDAAGHFYIVDGANLIRRIKHGVVSTIFSPANTTLLPNLSSIINIFYSGGYVYVSDSDSFDTYRFAV
jgi:hypothetical protein